MAQMRKTPKGQSSTGKFIGTMEATKAKELKRIKEGKPTYVGKPARSKSGASTVAAVAKRFGVTAREARDIATAIGTMAQTATSSKNPQSKGPSGKNLIKQVKETAVAAATGKKGTTSDKVPYTGSMTAQYTGRYSRGTKRK